MPLNVALLGPAGIGLIHAREFAHAGAHIAGVLASTMESTCRHAAQFSEKFGYEIKAHENLDDVLRSPVQAISICTPAEAHLSMIDAALDAGKYVFAEKPLFWNAPMPADDVARICAQLRNKAAGRLLVNTSNVTFLKSYAAHFPLPRVIDEFYFRFATHGRYRFRDIGIDLLPHAFSLLLELAPDGIASELTQTVSEYTYACAFKFSGIRVNFEFCQDPAMQRELVFAVNGRRVRRIQQPTDNGLRILIDCDDAPDHPIDVPDPFRVFIDGFVRAAECGGSFEREAPMIGRNMELLAAFAAAPAANAMKAGLQA